MSVIRKAKGFSAAQERPVDRIEAQDRAEAMEPKGPEQKPMDKVTALLNDPVFITDYTWPFMAVPGVRGSTRQLFVTRFYPRKNFALDMFQADVPDAVNTNMKERLLRDHGIRYFCLHTNNRLADLAAYMAQEWMK
jgi:hypothetical protein